MPDISAKQVKELRDLTGAGMMDCKRALEEVGGDLEKARELLRKQGLAAADKKAGRQTSEGLIDAYIHHGGTVGAMVEVNCETDFVARTKDFQEFVHNLSLQVAAAAPKYVRREDVPPEVVERERKLFREQAAAEGKPDHILDRIVEGKLDRFFSEICLEEQPYIRDDSLTIGELRKQLIAKLGENIHIRRFSRFSLGEDPETASENGAPAP